METITFETKCYENDWKFLLQTPYLDKMIKRCNTNFQHKQLIINNVEDLNLVCKYADQKVKEGIIDSYYIVNDYIKDTLDFFELSKHALGKGYYYSIAELVGLYLSRTNYHLHFSSDAYMERNLNSSWIEQAILLMNKDTQYAVANPTWNRKFKEVQKLSIGETENFYINYGFSDQCYLVKTSLFRKAIYNEKNALSSRYPKYGGELFEKRVDSYLRNHELKRLVHKEESYIHRNFPKNKLVKRLRMRSIMREFRIL